MDIQAQMAGTVFRLLVTVGQSVEAGEDVIILESMKMEIPQSAPQAGVVREIYVQEGDFIDEGQTLMRIEP
ncbi:MAG: acetyl-CoA carboxylase biotin carboxyl carrier protein subunit [Candidatus Carbobacillus sp.]|nr:acetyl-CoA carboxylase biotin carboxyl carrier protein subunit [Candidatus Carbobacillus sp.]